MSRMKKAELAGGRFKTFAEIQQLLFISGSVKRTFQRVFAHHFANQFLVIRFL